MRMATNRKSPLKTMTSVKKYALSPDKLKWLTELSKARRFITPGTIGAVGLGGGIGAATGLATPPDQRDQREQLDLSDLPRNLQEAMGHPLLRDLLAKYPKAQEAVEKIPAALSAIRTSPPVGYAIPKIGIGPMFKKVRPLGGLLKTTAAKKVPLGLVAGGLVTKATVVDPIIDDWAMRRAQKSMMR